MEIKEAMVKDEDIRIKYSRSYLNGEQRPVYSIYYQDRFQGSVYSAREIETFIAAIPAAL